MCFNSVCVCMCVCVRGPCVSTACVCVCVCVVGISTKETNVQLSTIVFQLFPPGAIPIIDKGEEFKGDRDVTALLKGMVQFVEKQSAGNRPKSWPKLHVLK